MVVSKDMTRWQFKEISGDCSYIGNYEGQKILDSTEYHH